MNEPRGTRICILIEPDGIGRKTGYEKWQGTAYDYDALTLSHPDRVKWKELIGAILAGAIAGAILSCMLR